MSSSVFLSVRKPYRPWLPIMTLICLCISARAQTISHFEYFVDADPGAGLATPLNPTPAATINNFAIAIPLNSLPAGYHVVSVRGQSSAGEWTETIFYKFFVVTPPPAATNLVQMEYFIDSDPGFGAGSQVPGITSTPALNNIAVTANLTSLSVGFHSFFVRSKNAAGQWSQTNFSRFYVAPVLTATNLVKFEYFFDTDPGYNNGTAFPIAPPVPAVANQNIAAIPSSLAEGNHTLYIRAEDANGVWTTVASEDFTVSPASACGLGEPGVVPGSGCSNSPISMTAVGATGTQEYRWYNVPTGGTSLSPNTTYAPTLTANATYYVSIFDPAKSCESNRNTVTAMITSAPPKPAITVVGTSAFCDGTSITLAAPTGYTDYLWSDGNTNQSRTVATAGAFTVQVGSGPGCQSVASDPVTTTLLPAPSQPVVSGSTDICNGKTAVLSGPAGFNYQWSDNETTQSISVTTQGDVTLVVIDAKGCKSPASVPVTVSCSNVAPVIAPTVLSTYINGKITFPLLTVISDTDDNLDPSSLAVTSSTISQPHASIDANYNLVLDYTDIAFTGTDHLILKACDFDAACTTREIDVDVAGDIVIYNGVSPNGDNQNDVFLLQFIDLIPETQANKVTIVNRWGDVVYDADNYNNTTVVFAGKSNSGNTLPDGTYFYRITFASGKKQKTGYLSLK